MAWNPSPGVARARDIGRQTNSDQVIVILISRKRETMENEQEELRELAERMA